MIGLVRRRCATALIVVAAMLAVAIMGCGAQGPATVDRVESFARTVDTPAEERDVAATIVGRVNSSAEAIDRFQQQLLALSQWERMDIGSEPISSLDQRGELFVGELIAARPAKAVESYDLVCEEREGQPAPGKPTCRSVVTYEMLMMDIVPIAAEDARRSIVTLPLAISFTTNRGVTAEASAADFAVTAPLGAVIAVFLSDANFEIDALAYSEPPSAAFLNLFSGFTFVSADGALLPAIPVGPDRFDAGLGGVRSVDRLVEEVPISLSD